MRIEFAMIMVMMAVVMTVIMMVVVMFAGFQSLNACGGFRIHGFALFGGTPNVGSF